MPKGILVYIHSSSPHQIAVLGWSSGETKTCAKPDLKSTLLKYRYLHARSNRSSGRGMTPLSGNVKALMAL